MSGKNPLLAIALLISLAATARLAADCSPAVAVLVPPTACKSGSATVGVVAVPGGSYAWTVAGGQIIGDASGDRIMIALGTGATATVSVTVKAGICVSQGSGIIALHDPFGVRVAAIPAGRASEPLTVVWAYDNGTPGSQTISTGDSGVVVTLAPDVRSYTYTPQTSGSKQFVIDAALKTTTTSPPPASRQRAVAKGPVSASTCAAAHAAMPYTVGVCADPAVVIEGPDSVITGTAFSVAVRPQPGALATWTITNGSPATATGDSVMVTAGASGNVGVAVRLTRGACSGALEHSIAIVPQPACDSPKATVSLGPLSCGSAIVNATFTGTPPFQGVWSDGVHFDTSAPAIARPVTIPGNYKIVSFQDAVCQGPASAVAVVPALLPTATVYGSGNNCTLIDSVTAQFTGKPPFSACWNDGTCFQTNQMQISKLLTTYGTNTLTSGADADGCPLTISGAVSAIPSQQIQLTGRCRWSSDLGNFVDLDVLLLGSFYRPAAVTWSDGVVSDGSRYALKPTQTTTYTLTGITSGHSGVCDVVFDNPRSVTVYPNPVPGLAPATGDLCAGATLTTSLTTPPPPGTQVTWFVYNGTILSGQGTNTMQYQAQSSTCCASGGVGATFTFADPNHCPLTNDRRFRIPAESSATITLPGGVPLKAGKTYLFSFGVGFGVTSWSFDNSMGDSITQVGPCNAAGNGDTCYAQYTSTHGPGQSTITLHANGPCPTKDVSAVLTIEP